MEKREEKGHFSIMQIRIYFFNRKREKARIETGHTKRIAALHINRISHRGIVDDMLSGLMWGTRVLRWSYVILFKIHGRFFATRASFMPTQLL